MLLNRGSSIGDDSSNSNDDDMGDESSHGMSDDSWASGSQRFASTFEGDERRIRQRLFQLYPRVDVKRFPLPRMWSTSDKFHFLDITHNALRVSYRGDGKHQQKDAASARADVPIPPQCGVYYFEVTIIKGQQGCMGIGMCGKDVNLNRLPGWDRFSYGYHGDDGHFFSYSGNGVAYGPKFTTGDIVGCGVNLVCRTIFFTKNGVHLGVASREVERIDDLYPTVGLQTSGEVIDVNFGQKPFVFDIEPEMATARASVTSEILATELPPEKTEWMNKLVSSWMSCEGYGKAMTSFCRAAKITPEEDEQSIDNRKEIVSLVMSGRTGEAIRRMEELHQGIFEHNKSIALVLKCQEFVEMAAELAKQDSHSKTLAVCTSNGQSTNQSIKSPQGSGVTANPHKRSHSSHGMETSVLCDVEGPPIRKSPPFTEDEPLIEIEMEDEPCSSSSRNGCERKNGNGSAIDDGMIGIDTATTIEEETFNSDEECDGEENNSNGYSNANYGAEYQKYAGALDFGRSVYALSLQIDNLSGCMKAMLNDALSSICLSDYAQFVSHRLLSNEHLRDVAKQASAAILEFGQHSAESRLLQYFGQWHNLHKELGAARVPHAAFSNVNEVVFGETAPSFNSSSLMNTADDDDASMVVG